MKKRITRSIEFVLVDIVVIVSTFWVGMYYMNENNILGKNLWFWYLVILVGMKVLCYSFLRLYNLLLDYVGFNEVVRILIGVFFTDFIYILLLETINPNNIRIETVLFIAPIEVLLMLASRFSKRILIALGLTPKSSSNRNKYIRTLIIGAGSAAKLAYDEIKNNAKLKNKVIAFVDDDNYKVNTRLNGVPIVGPITNISEIINHFHIQEIIIAISNIDKPRLKEIIEFISTNPVKVKRLPIKMEEDFNLNKKIVDVKIEDLLNRGVIKLDNNGLFDFISSKVVLVTGGGGSIGSELCTQILNYNPKYLILFDIYENTTYNIQLELLKRIRDEKRNTQLIVNIGSVYNSNRLEEVFKTYNPNIVFHAAAYKHVPLMENNAVEAVRTNVLGTYNVARLCDKYHVEKMTLISTDKAVRPTNVMGATKAVCEKIIQYFDSISQTSYAAVRFGNVLGSNGSVVPLFKKQIEDGGPITITHPEITRYFMTIPEAVSLILQSAVYAEGGEIFILDMGKPVKIKDLAEKMIRLSGYIPNVDILIEYIGLRPGEKLYEELLLDESKNTKTANDKIYIEEKQEICDIEGFIELVKKSLDNLSNDNMKELVHSLISAYNIQKN